MRNLLEYPITTQEAVEVLQRIKEDIIKEYDKNMIIGDMRGVVIDWVIERINRTNELPWLLDGWDSHSFNSGGSGPKID
jgi:hypothetical protein